MYLVEMTWKVVPFLSTYIWGRYMRVCPSYQKQKNAVTYTFSVSSWPQSVLYLIMHTVWKSLPKSLILQQCERSKKGIWILARKFKHLKREEKIIFGKKIQMEHFYWFSNIVIMLGNSKSTNEAPLFWLFLVWPSKKKCITDFCYYCLQKCQSNLCC